MQLQRNDFIVGAVSGGSWMAKDTGTPDRPTHDEIARLAYHLYEANGRREGRDLKDWLLAEQELKHHYA
jgi:hypothetical protein